MDIIEKAELYFIIPISTTLETQLNLKEDKFLKKLIYVQKDEFSQDVCSMISRKKLVQDKLQYHNYIFQIEIYLNNYKDYNSSLIYIKLSITEPIAYNDYANLIHAKNILNHTYIKDRILVDYIKDNIKHFHGQGEIFLFSQISKISPPFPETYDGGIAYIKNNEQKIHKLLLRSTTYHNHLRINNHQANFDSIANFYGTIDICSPITLIQFYQQSIRSLNGQDNDIDIIHRACWWLVVTDMIFIQKSVLADTLKTISQVQANKKTKTVKATTQIGKVLLNMKDFWYLEDLTHEISKAVLYKVKEKVGVNTMLNNVLERVEYLENLVLRELNEDQNKHNYYLNIILLMIAMIQIIPIIYDILNSLFIKGAGFSMHQLWLWIQSFFISITLPAIIWILHRMNERKFVNTMLTLKKSNIIK